ncbi:right-handed parallel beta-helix repeat-containing protein, partial [Candidatus Pacearchaeota archaeon]|nr:right-handed parallel beta-helix repeat-containing protein [Candidatus Pacearchaeota archaeon]
MISIKKMGKRFVLVFLFLVFLVSSASGIDYYVCSDGSDSSGDGSLGDPWQTIQYGINQMSGGDTLIVKNGTYTGTANRIYNVPSGSASQYTIVRAEEDWGVTLSATTGGAYSSPVRIEDSSYIIIRGFKIKNSAESNVWIDNSDHIKVIRCSSDGIEGGVGSSFGAFGGSQYVLFEECHSYGAGRYTFAVGGTNSAGVNTEFIIFRRNVCRWDFSNTHEPLSCFNTYDRRHVLFQNNIAIDGKDIRSQDTTYDGLKGFFTANGASELSYQGNIVLNLEGAGYWMEDRPISNIIFENSISWDLKDARFPSIFTDGYPSWLLYIRSGDGPVNINHCTFGVSDLGGGFNGRPMPNDYLTNSIIYGVELDDGIYANGIGWTVEDYNSYYANTGDRNVNGGVGSNSIENINPLSNSLLYIPRIESGSDLSSIANDGGPIGATIVKRYGVSGTLYGETGYDILTNEDLWPWPNEDIIKEDMASFSKSEGEFLTSSYSSCTIDSATDTITMPNHGLSANNGISFDGTILPSGISKYQRYNVVNPSTNTFQITPHSKTGTIIDFSDNGVGIACAEGWNNPSMSGDRGFASSTDTNLYNSGPVTLTSYIWEYLGNECPSDICGGGSSSVCGDGTIEGSETCDDGVSNGVVCSPIYDGSCSYCSNSCTTITLQGSYCGDGNCDAGNEDETSCVADCASAGECDSANVLCVDDSAGVYQEYSTIQAAASVALPGDTVYVKAGTYEEQVTPANSGTVSNRIYYKAYPGDMVIIDGGNSRDYGFYLENDDYITIEGFNFQNTVTAGISFRFSDYVELKNNTAASAGRWGFYSAYSSDALLESNEGHGNSEHGYYAANGGDNIIVRNNIFYDNTRTGFQFNADGHEIMYNALIEGNIVYDNVESTMDFVGLYNSVIQNNLAYNSQSKSMVFWDSGYGSWMGCKNNLVIGNTFHMASGVDREGILVRSFSTNNTIKNNIFYTFNSPALEIRADSVQDTLTDNNILYNSQGDKVLWAGNSYTLEEYRSATGNGQNSFDTNPLFVDVGGLDFHLQDISPAKDVGASESSPSYDLEGNLRPQGSGYDIGAYESQSGSSPQPTCQLTSA